MRVYELRFNCPDLRTQEDADGVRASLLDAPGIEDVDVDWRAGKVRAVASSQDYGATVLRHLIEAGFPPED